MWIDTAIPFNTMSKLIVPEHLKKTYRGELFLLEDSNDEERVLLFSTEQNMKLLSSNSDWLGDGTFKILPLLFYQLYSVLVIINNYILPLAFGLLPNKKQKINVKFFSMIKKHLNAYPSSHNVGFERALFNAVGKVFGNDVEIYGCYFHLSQNFFKHVKNLGLYVLYKTDFRFKHCFLLTQSLAFIPTDDVLEGFLKVKSNCLKNCAAFEPYLDYIETYNVGKLDDKLHKRLNLISQSQHGIYITVS